MHHADDDWAGGLMGYSDDCPFCLLACICPPIAYGLNFQEATGDSECACILPFISHTLLDAVVTPLVCCAYHSTGFALPLACCLRYNHRRVAVKAAGAAEPKLDSFIAEVFCWGCSQAQVKRQRLRHCRGNTILGTLSAPVAPIPIAVPFVNNSINNA